MTRKDYVLIADALKASRVNTSAINTLPGVNVAAVNLADALGRDNPRFDRARFLEACGVAS